MFFKAKKIPLLVSIPHSGEKVPDFCEWLKAMPEPILMCDVDRFVDILYEPALAKLKIDFVKTDWHRYAADLNRIPEDIDCGSVIGSSNKLGTFNRGFHWQITTQKNVLMKTPMSQEMHQKIVKLIYEPFHESIRKQYENFKKNKFQKVFHLDVHSMPSLGTSEHRDPGQKRAEIVVSDCQGKSSSIEFVELVKTAYLNAGFKVAYNWPYFGGRVSEQYGQPSLGHHAVQVELNRSLYMDEVTKKLLPSHKDVQLKIKSALSFICKELPSFLK